MRFVTAVKGGRHHACPAGGDGERGITMCQLVVNRTDHPFDLTDPAGCIACLKAIEKRKLIDAGLVRYR